MAMHIVKSQKKKVQKAVTQAMPYKSRPESLPVAEDTEKAERVFGGGDTGGRYNMILLASIRSYDLARGAIPLMPQGTHKPNVQAMLEIEAGLVDRSYVAQYRNYQSKGLTK